MASTKTKKFGLFLASSEIEENGFFWYDSEPEMYEDIAKNLCKMYFDSEDVNRQNDFLKNFDVIVRAIKKSGLSSNQILARIKLLLDEFKIKENFYDLDNSYIGSGLSLWISQDSFPMQLRGAFRSSLYGFYLENNIDLGRAPIDFKETIRFEEFLEGPISF